MINAQLKGASGRPLLTALQKEVSSETRRGPEAGAGLGLGASGAAAAAAAGGGADDRLAQLKAKLRNSTDDTF